MELCGRTLHGIWRASRLSSVSPPQPFRIEGLSKRHGVAADAFAAIPQQVGVVSQDWNFSQVEVEMVESWWNSDMNMIENGKNSTFFLGALKGSTSRGTNNFVPEEDWLISIS